MEDMRAKRKLQKKYISILLSVLSESCQVGRQRSPILTGHSAPVSAPWSASSAGGKGLGIVGTAILGITGEKLSMIFMLYHTIYSNYELFPIPYPILPRQLITNLQDKQGWLRRHRLVVFHHCKCSPSEERFHCHRCRWASHCRRMVSATSIYTYYWNSITRGLFIISASLALYLSTTVPSGHTHVGLLLSEHLGLFAPFWKTLNGLPRLWQETRASNTDKTTASVLIMLLVQTPAVNCAGLSCFRVWEFGRNVL